jgi:hypothetical protein
MRGLKRVAYSIFHRRSARDSLAMPQVNPGRFCWMCVTNRKGECGICGVFIRPEVIMDMFTKNTYTLGKVQDLMI